jgi:ABC-type dipeptide/oligopeptide/nickel transport system ATPase component
MTACSEDALSSSAVLSAELSVDYPIRPGVLRNIHIDISAGEMFGLVGESGSGKSTLALAILRLLGNTGAQVRGRLNLTGNDLLAYNERQLRDLRGRLVSWIPQNSGTSLNPALRIETQFHEAWRAHSERPWSFGKGFVKDLLASVRISEPADILRRFPTAISAGQAQRILIAMALLHSPRLLIADEPTSALDVITQRGVLELLVRIAKEQNTAVLFISHDIHTVAAICDRIGILYGGELVECGPASTILNTPCHPYTKEFLAAVPNCFRNATFD